MKKESPVQEAAEPIEAPQVSPNGWRGGGEERLESHASRVQFAATIFLSAFLLFQVQPLIGKYILPWFGGGPAVWTTCMLFFQVVLLVGYAYAHFISTLVPWRLRAWIHLALLAVSLLVLPITPDAGVWKPSPGDSPTLHILLLLLFNVGVPYLLLSSTAPLIQRWFSHAHPKRSPYRLYALSNTGSLLALLSYPVIFEPAMTLERQVVTWSWAYVAFVLLCGWSAVRATVHQGSAGTAASDLAAGVREERDDANRRPPGLSTVLLWLGLAAVASSMLLATTNQMCQEVAVVPFLWVLPLALYLTTFIICFDHARWYKRRRFGLLLAVAAPAACVVLYGGVHVDIRIQIAVYSLALFACCMTCHGELVRSKPDPRYLTLFYLLVAAGGALGGVFVAIGAPRLFAGYWEFHISLVGCILLTLVAWYRSRTWVRYFREPQWAWGGMATLLAILSVALAAQAYVIREGSMLTARSFYGILRLTEVSDQHGVKKALSHGKVVHGIQFVEPAKQQWPTAYYGPQSGVGLAIQNHPRRFAAGPADRKLRVGVVGLGVGTVAAFGVPADYFRFYEINRDVIRICREHFSYVADSPAEVDIMLGDARVQMELEATHGDLQQFDVLAVDAFSSDSIPVHLITRESVQLYLDHLKDDGLLLFHITNRSLDLGPVTRGLARQFDLQALQIKSQKDDTKAVSLAAWVILTRNRDFLANTAVQKAASRWSEDDRPPLLWTDNFASLWQILKH